MPPPLRLLSAALCSLASAVVFAAPAITTHPGDLSVISGSPATLRVGATGTGQLTYQWRRNGFAISGATTPTFTIASASRTDADYYAVGVTDSSGATTVSNSATLAVAPVASAASVALDPAWNLQLEDEQRSYYLRASVPIPDGGFYVAGRFSSVAGVRRTCVFRINRDGTLSSTFSPAEIEAEVQSLALQPDGKLLVGGDFAHVGGYSRAHVARLNQDGSVDSGFVPDTNVSDGNIVDLLVQRNGQIIVRSDRLNQNVWRLNADGSRDARHAVGTPLRCTAIALQADDKLILCGLFSSIGGVTRNQVARLNADGSVDPTFDPGLGGFGTVRAAVQTDGRILLAGSIGYFGGAPASGVVRLHANGARDLAFDVRAGLPAPSYVTALVLDSSQRILLGGLFSSFAATNHQNVVRLLPDGSVDNTMQSLTTDGLVQTISVAPSSVAGTSDGRILLGGYFSKVGTTPRGGLVRYLPSDSVDLAFQVFNYAGPGEVLAVAAAPGGKYLVGGRFTSVRGARVTGSLIRVNGDGSLDRTFNPNGLGLVNVSITTPFQPPAEAPRGEVHDILVLPDGRIAVSGWFTHYNDLARRNLVILRADGAPDPTFAPPVGADAGVFSMAVLPGRKLLLGGTFTNFNAVTRTRIASISLDGELDYSIFSSAAGLNATVRSVAVQRDGKIIAAGDFTAHGSSRVGGLFRFNADGTPDSAFLANLGTGFDAGVDQIALQADGRILAGGVFKALNGRPASGLVRFNPDGTRDASFADPRLIRVSAFAPAEDGSVIVLSHAERPEIEQSFLFRLSSSGSRILPGLQLAGGTPYELRPGRIVVQDSGQLILSAGPLMQGLMATRAASLPAITAQPASQVAPARADVTFSANVAAGGLPVSYQWLLNGVPVPGATTPSLVTSTAGSYTLRVTSELGSITSSAAILSAPEPISRLGNVATRARHVPGDRGLIAGFVLGGSEPKPVLIRAVGPTLAAFGVDGTLPDPVLDLFRGPALVATNDDWSRTAPGASSPAEIAAAAARAGAFALAPNSKDAALLITLSPGSYTAMLRATGDGTGIGIIEVYDASEPFNGSRLLNLSTRGEVGIGNAALFAGLNISGPKPRKVLVRAAGPALGPFGVQGALSDPLLEVFDGAASIATNDDWDRPGSEREAIETATRQVGAFDFSPGSRDAAILVTLAPGSYSVRVRGAGDATGVALIEIYDVP